MVVTLLVVWCVAAFCLAPLVGRAMRGPSENNGVREPGSAPERYAGSRLGEAAGGEPVARGRPMRGKRAAVRPELA